MEVYGSSLGVIATILQQKQHAIRPFVEAVRKILLLMLLKISLLDHPFSWLSYKVSGQYKEMIMIGVLRIVVVCFPPLALVPALPSSPSQDDVTDYCLPNFKLLRQLSSTKQTCPQSVVVY